MFKQNDQFITKAFYFGSERLKTAQSKSTSVTAIELLQATKRERDSKPHYLIDFVSEMVAVYLLPF